MLYKNGYYFIDNGNTGLKYRLFGMSDPVCLPAEYVERLSKEWGEDLTLYMHTATAAEINEYGIYNIK